MAPKDDQTPLDDLQREEEAGVATQEEKKSQKPRRYRVLLLNDDYTLSEAYRRGLSEAGLSEVPVDS